MLDIIDSHATLPPLFAIDFRHCLLLPPLSSMLRRCWRYIHAVDIDADATP